MLIVDGKLVSDDIIEEQFVCNLLACKGACCHEGDYGAPVDETERAILEDIYPDIKPYLTQRGIAEIEATGLYEYVDEAEEYATPCIDNAACAYMIHTKEGFAACGIEVAYRAGATTFKKPISCELYPIRVESDDRGGFEALNYDRWDICAAACTNGEKLQVPIYQFVKAAILRKWGIGFYEQLDAAYKAQVLRQIDDE